MIAEVSHFQSPLLGLLVLSEPSTRPLQLRSTLFLPGILVFPAHVPGFSDRYQLLIPKNYHQSVGARDLQSVLRPRALGVDGSPLAEGEACREPRFSKSRPSCS